MNNAHREVSQWLHETVLPTPCVTAALVAMMGLWWGGQHWMIAPRWQALSHRIHDYRYQSQITQEQLDEAHHIPVKGRRVAVAEEVLRQLSLQYAADLGLKATTVQWQAENKTLQITVQGKDVPLLRWWDVVGRSVLLGEVTYWQLQPIENELATNDHVTSYQLSVVLRPERWRWEALPSQ